MNEVLCQKSIDYNGTLEFVEGLSSKSQLDTAIDTIKNNSKGLMLQCLNYIEFFILVTGFFPFYMVLSGLPKLNRVQRKVTLFCYIVVTGIIVSTCLLEYHPNQTQNVRIHYRYMFWVLPLLLSAFNCVVENRLVNKWIYIVSGLIGGGLYFMCSNTVSGHLFDAISAKPLSIIKDQTIFMIFRIVILVLIAITFMMISKGKTWIFNVIWGFVVVVLFVTDVHSNRLQYLGVKEVYKDKCVDYVKDAYMLNEYLNEDLCLFVGDTMYSLAFFETYYPKNYVYTNKEKFCNDLNYSSNTFSIGQVSRWYQIDKENVDYIVSEETLEYLSDYEVNIGMIYHHIYTREAMYAKMN